MTTSTDWIGLNHCAECKMIQPDDGRELHFKNCIHHIDYNCEACSGAYK